MLWLWLAADDDPADHAILATLPEEPIGRLEGTESLPIVEVDPDDATDPWPEAQAIEAALRARAAAGEAHPKVAYPFDDKPPELEL